MISRQTEDRYNESKHLGILGSIHAQLGEVEQAISYYEQALEIAREIGDRQTEINQLGSLGLIHRDSGQISEARKYLQLLLPLLEESASPQADLVRQVLNELGPDP
jgi:tetratricopeptide (TPR) repeat protein